jgi:very-short-patch-repair endonuclease
MGVLPRPLGIQWRRERELRDRARDLRQMLTTAEIELWKHVRKGKAEGHHFRRQHPIDEFIVDFCCVKQRLCVELDGDYHEEPEALAYDQWRQRRLESLGWKVIRFRNEDVLADPGEVRERILAILAEMKV